MGFKQFCWTQTDLPRGTHSLLAIEFLNHVFGINTRRCLTFIKSKALQLSSSRTNMSWGHPRLAWTFVLLDQPTPSWTLRPMHHNPFQDLHHMAICKSLNRMMYTTGLYHIMLWVFRSRIRWYCLPMDNRVQGSCTLIQRLSPYSSNHRRLARILLAFLSGLSDTSFLDSEPQMLRSVRPSPL